MRPIVQPVPTRHSPDAGQRLAAELLASEKEPAELVMITDLLRNDVGRVAEFGSARVPDLLRLEAFAQVQHLVSTVEGRLRPGLSHLEALATCFPGGSITGAPKLRAMEIIDEPRFLPLRRSPHPRDEIRGLRHRPTNFAERPGVRVASATALAAARSRTEGSPRFRPTADGAVSAGIDLRSL